LGSGSEEFLAIATPVPYIFPYLANGHPRGAAGAERLDGPAGARGGYVPSGRVASTASACPARRRLRSVPGPARPFSSSSRAS